MAKTVEISEEEFLNNKKLREQFTKVYGNEKARKLVEQAYKIVEPTAATPTIDAETERNAPVTELSKKFDDFVKAQGEQREKDENDRKLTDFTREVENQYAQLVKDGWTKEGIEGVKKISTEKNLMPLDAAAIFERNNPPPAVVTAGVHTGPWNFMHNPDDGNELLKKLVETKGENENVLNRLIDDGLSEIRGQTPSRR